MARTEEEIIGGYITVRIGDEARRLPTLKIAESRVWKQAFSKAFAGDLASPRQPGSAAMLAFMAADHLGSTVMLDLIVAYDKTKVLGGRKEIERVLDDDQMYAIYNQLIEVTFRFARELTATQLAMMVGAPQTVAPLNGASLPSLPSPSGDSGPTDSPPN